MDQEDGLSAEVSPVDWTPFCDRNRDVFEHWSSDLSCERETIRVWMWVEKS